MDSPGTTPLCACETFNRKRGLIKSPGKEVEEVPVIGVASVFTPSQNRGKGFAGVMMQLLSKRARNITGARGFSVLYSDIGPEFYHKNGGWKAFEGFELVIPSSQVFHNFQLPSSVSLQQAKDCIERDTRILRQEFSSLADPATTTVQMIPQWGELEWAHLRGQHAGRHLNIDVGDIVGAEVSGGSDGDWGYILWFHEFKDSSLTVLRIREPSADSGLQGLLYAALNEARRLQLSKVTIWSPNQRLKTLTGEQIVMRKHSLPALLVLSAAEGESNASESPSQKLIWRNIEKLGWC